MVSSALFSICYLAIATTMHGLTQAASLPLELPTREVVKDIPGHHIKPARSLAEELKNRAAAASISIPATDNVHEYTVTVSVGSPAKEYKLRVETGSALTWLSEHAAWNQTSTSQDTGIKASQQSQEGHFIGELWSDTVTLGGVAVDHQVIGIAQSSDGLPAGIDGVLGIGPMDLNDDITEIREKIPTVFDNLSSKSPDYDLFSFSFNPTVKEGEANGCFDIGKEPVANRYTGTINYVPITSKAPSSLYWGIDAAASYGTSNILPLNSGIIDSAALQTLLNTDAFNQYVKATGAVVDSKTGYLSVTSDQYAKMQSLFFQIGNTQYEMIPNAQIVPRAYNSIINGDANAIYLAIGDLGPHSQDFGFVLGKSFLQRFFTVYDASQKRIGFAQTAHTADTTN